MIVFISLGDGFVGTQESVAANNKLMGFEPMYFQEVPTPLVPFMCQNECTYTQTGSDHRRAQVLNATNLEVLRRGYE